MDKLLYYLGIAVLTTLFVLAVFTILSAIGGPIFAGLMLIVFFYLY